MKRSNNPRVSIGMPVYNGSNFIGEAIESILDQSYKNFELIISDNASIDQTREICLKYANKDSRVYYHRSTVNRGAAWNYKTVFELSSGQYFKWAAHDDLCRPDYLTRCVQVLDREPSIVLCHSQTANIDEHGQYIKMWGKGPQLGSEKPHIRFRNALSIRETFFVWGLIRNDILKKTRLLGSFTGHDRPLLSSLSLFGRFYEIPEVLFLQREHKEKSIYAYNWRRPREAIVWYDPKMANKIIFPTWRLFTEHVLGTKRAPLNCRERILCYGEVARWLKSHNKELLRDLILAGENLPIPWFKWLRRFDKLANDIDTVIPARDSFILVDEETLETEVFGNRRTIPFLEKDGLYWGLPPDDDTAIRELERLRRSGISFIVFAWPTFWWLDHYAKFSRYLHEKFQCVLQTDRLIVFNLQL